MILWWNSILTVFKDIASLIETYLTQFQSDVSLAPFINGEMVQQFTKIMQFFIKRNALDETSSDYKLININVTKKENRIESAAIKLPTATSNFLLKSSYSKEKKIEYWGDCVAILMNIILKQWEHSPMKSVLVRKASCLSPANMLIWPNSLKYL